MIAIVRAAGSASFRQTSMSLLFEISYHLSRSSLGHISRGKLIMQCPIFEISCRYPYASLLYF